MPSKEEKDLARLRFIEHVEGLDLDLLSALFNRNSLGFSLTTCQIYIEDLAIDQYTLNNIIVYTDLVLMSNQIFKYYTSKVIWNKQVLFDFLKESGYWQKEGLKWGITKDYVIPEDLVYVISDYYNKPKDLVPLLLAQLKAGTPILSGMDYQLNLYFMKCKALGDLYLDPKVTHVYEVCFRESAVKMFNLTYGENSLVRLLETTSVSLNLILESTNSYCGLELDKSFYVGTLEMDFRNSRVLISEVGSREKSELDIVRSIAPTLVNELMLLSTFQFHSEQPGGVMFMNRLGTRKGYMSLPNLGDKSEVFAKRHPSHFWGSVVVQVPPGYYEESMGRLNKILNTIYSGFLIQAVRTEKSSAFGEEAIGGTYLTKPFYLTVEYSALVIDHELPEISVKLEAKEEVEVVTSTRIRLEFPSPITNPEMLQDLSDLRRYLSTFLDGIDFNLQVLPAFKQAALEEKQREKIVQGSLTWGRLTAYTKFKAISYSVPTVPTLSHPV